MMVGGTGRSEQKREHAGVLSKRLVSPCVVNHLALEMLKEAANPDK